jgi:quinol monooxygenase YgiN
VRLKERAGPRRRLVSFSGPALRAYAPAPADSVSRMNQIQVNARFPSIPANNVAEFKRLAAQALEIARAEAGTLQYAWFLSDDETVCVVRETFEDSAALLTHVANLGDTFGRVLEVGGGCTFELLGDPSPELVEATTGLDLSIFRYFQEK